MKRTKWFKGCKPVRVGLYQRRLPQGFVHYSWWNGRFWGSFAYTPERAVIDKHLRSVFQDLPWRGLQEAA